MPDVIPDTRAGVIPAGGIAALLIDGDRAFVQFAREELNQTAGPPVCLLHAASLAQAEAILAGTSVDVILLSPLLPDGDGFGWLESRRGGLKAGVLVLATDRAPDPVSLDPGVQGVLVKAQVDGDHLAAAIRQAVDREQARQQLLRSPDHFQSLIEHASDLITVVDQAGRIVYQSPAAVGLLGTSPQVFHGRLFAELVHPEDAGKARALVEQVFDGERTARGEFRLPHADGSMRTVEVVASRMTLAGDPCRAVLNGRDLTERRRAEDALRVREAQLMQAQKMEAVGRLAGGIAHDFSNVLTVVAGACERLREQIVQGRAEPAQVDLILRHCARATALTRQLLAFSRSQTIAPRVLDLGELVRRAGELIVQLIGSHVRVEIETGEHIAPVEADPVQMEQVLMNLAINARDAMPGGGLLKISVENVQVTPSLAAMHPPLGPGPYVRLQVVDSGHGMTQETAARAFEPFFTTKDPSRGTGLGLATVYGIVTQCRGHVRIDSAPGRGTRFVIHLPASEGRVAVEPSDAASERASLKRRATILVTEDDPDLRAMLGETLEQQGFAVVAAEGPDEAIRVIEDGQKPVDLLLTDLVMPGGSGRDLARRIARACPGLRVLYMSGYGGPGSGHGDQLEPGDPFLPKPFSSHQLVRAVEALLA